MRGGGDSSRIWIPLGEPGICGGVRAGRSEIYWPYGGRDGRHGIEDPRPASDAAGGGGKGMRLVRSAGEMRSSFEAARSEAERSFGDGEVYLEKLLERTRHIET